MILQFNFSDQTAQLSGRNHKHQVDINELSEYDREKKEGTKSNIGFYCLYYDGFYLKLFCCEEW